MDTVSELCIFDWRQFGVLYRTVAGFSPSYHSYHLTHGPDRTMFRLANLLCEQNTEILLQQALAIQYYINKMYFEMRLRFKETISAR